MANHLNQAEIDLARFLVLWIPELHKSGHACFFTAVITCSPKSNGMYLFLIYFIILLILQCFINFVFILMMY